MSATLGVSEACCASVEGGWEDVCAVILLCRLSEIAV